MAIASMPLFCIERMHRARQVVVRVFSLTSKCLLQIEPPRTKFRGLAARCRQERDVGLTASQLGRRSIMFTLS